MTSSLRGVKGSRVVEGSGRIPSSTHLLEPDDESRVPPSSPRPRPLRLRGRKSTTHERRQHQQPAYPPSPPSSQYNQASTQPQPQPHPHPQPQTHTLSHHPTNTNTNTHPQQPPYAQTTHSSQPHSNPCLDIPSSSQWPSPHSLASRARIEDDILGLALPRSRDAFPPYSMTARTETETEIAMETEIPDEEWRTLIEDEDEGMDVNVASGAIFGGRGNENGYGYGMTSHGEGEGGRDVVFAWSREGSGYGFEYGYDFMNRIDDDLARL